MTDDEQRDEQTDQAEEKYEQPEVEDLESDEGPTATAAGVSNGPG
jgi:hypothetical protein